MTLRRVTRGRAAVTALIAAVVGALAYLVGVSSLLGQRVEAGILGAADFTARPPAPLSLVSIPSVCIALVVLALIGWGVHRFRHGLWIVVLATLAIVASRLLKQQVLERPGLFELDVENTFPSGHMTVFTVLVAGLIWAVPHGSRGFVAMLGAILMGVVSWQLLAYGWHRPSDVVGAQALGVLAFAVGSILRPTISRASDASPSARAAVTRILCLVLSIAGVVLLLGAIVLVMVSAWFGSDRLMLAAAEIGTVALSSLCARIFVALAPA